jgi:carboxylesterase type B
VPPEKWAGIRKGNKFGPECLQMEIMVTARMQGDEDCLYLNVYTPRVSIQILDT